MKQLIDFIPLVIFFIVYKRYDIFYASGALMVTTPLALLATYLIYKKVEKVAKITCVIVMAFAALTLIFHSDAFIKWKVTIIYGLFALALLISQWFTKKPIIQRMLGSNQEIKLDDSYWLKLNTAWAIFFIACSGINIYVAFWMAQDVWVNFKVFGLTAATLIFTILSVVYIFKHMIKEPHTEKPEE
ncbi:Probable intracellular septation protein A [Providencia rustigianii]|uniref:Inner membrane-spanning protein YciB n=4 Tax=Providencia rustigianii TaxID=158850 RepID=D1NYK4_9GAMM|nr:MULTISPECIES: septation protein A [Providencia]EFB73552.1 intracellular septation protein A [Providencia rustigianii DSM 4541]MTC57576.1 septation protein A [Providencia rustigianii]MTC59088.1 septation protein A [Providencia rustigianii]SPY77670.1 Probable intracellular septation protein A [Providencia rustigianii]SUC27128.1 Probable intracellular septation protein A [Providencia rustigianii]